jgi:hypothetical protein
MYKEDEKCIQSFGNETREIHSEDLSLHVKNMQLYLEGRE